MPTRLDPFTVSFNIDTSGAEKGAQSFEKTVDRTGNRARASLSKIDGPVGGLQKSFQQLAQRGRESLRTLARSATVAFAAVTAGATSVIKEIGEVEKSFQTLAGSIARPIEETREAYGGLINDVVRLTGAKFRNTIVGFEKAISAGFRDPAVAAQLAFRGATAEAAGLVRTQSDLIRSATTVSSAIFGVDASAQQVDASMNLLIRTAQLADTEVAAMAPTFTTLSPLIQQFGASIEELATAQGLLSRSVRSPEQAAFAVQGIFRNLFTKTVQQRLQQQLGISSRQIEDSIRNGQLFDLLGEIRNRIEGQGRDLGQTLRGIVPSLYDQQAWTILLQNLGEVPGAFAHLRQEGNALDEVFENLQQSLQFNIERIRGNFQAGLQQGFNVELDLPTEQLEAFRELAFRAGRAVGRFVQILVENIDVIVRWAGYVAAGAAALAGFKIIAAIIPIAAALGSALLAIVSPVGLIIAGFAALSAASYALYTAWGEIESAFAQFGQQLVAHFTVAISGISVRVAQFRAFLLSVELGIRQLVERGINFVLRNVERLIDSVLEKLRLLPGFGDVAAGVDIAPIDITSGLRQEVDSQQAELESLRQDLVAAQNHLMEQQAATIDALGDVGTAVGDGFVGLYEGAIDRVTGILDGARALRARLLGEDDVSAQLPGAGDGERVNLVRPADVRANVQPAVDAVTESFRDGIIRAARQGGSLKEAAGTILSSIGDRIRDQALSNFADRISMIFSNLFNQILQSISSQNTGLGNSIGGFFSNAPRLHSGIDRVPGRPGQEMVAILEAGEAVIPAGQNAGGQQINVPITLVGNVDQSVESAMSRMGAQVANDVYVRLAESRRLPT